MAKYSIIIPFHSGKNYLSACLKSLIQTTPSDVEIIIVMNNSKKELLETIDIESINHCRCRIKIVEKDLMYPKAMNVGAEIASGKFLIFSDADTYYTHGWFEALSLYFLANENVGLVSSKLLDPKDSTIIDFGIGFTKYNAPHPFKGRFYNFKLAEESIEVQAACTANSMVSRNTFMNIGGFNEELPHSYSDIDLCMRLKENGLKTHCVHNSIVFHQGNSTNSSGMSDALKADTKGRFMALNAHKIETDMENYYKKAITYFAQSANKCANSFFLIDFTTIADKQWHYNLFSDLMGIELIDVYNCPCQQRDQNCISLYQVMDDNIRRLRYPLLFFVDTFRALENNDIWYYLRDVGADLIIDRNANILRFSELAPQVRL